MNIFYDIKNLPAIPNPVVTIGTFDGVHIGHKEIIKQLKQEARQCAGESVIITFAQHPRFVINPAEQVFLLNETNEKIKLFAAEEVDNLIIIDFTKAFFSQSATAYIEDFLVKYLQPACIIIGHDHRFGKDRSGDFNMLLAYGAKHHYAIKKIHAAIVQDAAVSSTKIRQALLQGNVKHANALLGYKYFFTGKVVEGNKLGRTIHYPTANIMLQNEQKLIPGNGVYAVYVYIDEDRTQQYCGMMNIGYKPTVGSVSRTIEVHIFNFDKDIYAHRLTIELAAYLRDEQKFNGLTALREQLAKDKVQAQAILNC